MKIKIIFTFISGLKRRCMPRRFMNKHNYSAQKKETNWHSARPMYFFDPSVSFLRCIYILISSIFGEFHDETLSGIKFAFPAKIKI